MFENNSNIESTFACSSASIPCSPLTSDSEDESITRTTVRRMATQDTIPSASDRPKTSKPRTLQRQSYIIRSQSSTNLSQSKTSPTRNQIKEAASTNNTENIDKTFCDNTSVDFDKENYSTNEDSMKRRTRPRSAPPPKKFNPTVPEPFEMTKREEKKRKERELALQFLAENIPNKEDLKTESKQFRAIEMPEHIKEKRYEKIIKSQEEKKKRAKEEAFTEMQKKMKPFRFVEREEQKYKMIRSDSTPNLQVPCAKLDFEATPFPEHIFTDYAEEQKKERENYRNIQKKLRQEMLLKKASYPPRMETDMIKKKLQENKMQIRTSHNQPKKAKRERTDLDRLYREHRENMEKKQKIAKQKEEMLTSGKAKLHQRKSKFVNRPSSADAVKRRPFSAISMATEKEMDALENCFNLTTQLRMQKMEENQLRDLQRKKQLENEEQEREERGRRRRINNPVWENIRNDLDNTEIEQLTKERLEEEKLRMKNYKVELEEMMRRVENQPTLFQKQSQLSAKKSMEKKYNQVLQKQGIDSEEIESMIENEQVKKNPSLMKLFPKTEENGIKIGIRKSKDYDRRKYESSSHYFDRKDTIEESEKETLATSIEMDQTYSLSEQSEAELAESVSLDVSVDTVKETD